MKSVAVAVALLAFSVGSAQAFTYQSTSQMNADVKSNLADPDDQLAAGKSKSGFSVHFSGGPTDSTGLGVQNRFLPTRNGAFNSPFQQQNTYDPFNSRN